jgi:hypothetical protein
VSRGRSVIIVLLFGLFIQAAGIAFHAHGIVIGGDCRLVRLVALFTTGLMAIMMVALVCWRARSSNAR